MSKQIGLRHSEGKMENWKIAHFLGEILSKSLHRLPAFQSQTRPTRNASIVEKVRNLAGFLSDSIIRACDENIHSYFKKCCRENDECQLLSIHAAK